MDELKIMRFLKIDTSFFLFHKLVEIYISTPSFYKIFKAI